MYQIQYDILGRCFILISKFFFFFLRWNFSYFLNDHAGLFCGPALLVLISTIWIPTDAPTDRISDATDFFVQHRADPLDTATAILQFKFYNFTISSITFSPSVITSEPPNSITGLTASQSDYLPREINLLSQKRPLVKMMTKSCRKQILVKLIYDCEVYAACK
jgi:hypothetical protein